MVFRSDPQIRAGQIAELQNGIRLHYASCGDPKSPLLLLLHGFPQCWFAWNELMSRWAARCHVVAPDMRGYNLSDKPVDTAQYQMPFLTADIVQLIDALGHDTANIVAHDWGGMVAWSTAIVRPDKVQALMILNAPHPVPFARHLASDPEQQRASRYMNTLRRPGVEEELLADQCAGLARFFRAPGSDSWFTPELATEYRAAWTRPGAATAMLNYYRASSVYPPQGRDAGAAALELDPDNYRVNVPVRILWGMRDSALLPSLLDGLENWIADLRIERLEDATHWLLHERPDVTASHIDNFVDEFTK